MPGTDTTELRWYAVRTEPRREKLVDETLRNEGIETLLPLRRRVSSWKGRSKVVSWPLFPGYCFARSALRQPSLILDTPGVLDIVGSGGTPHPVPEEEISALQRVIQSDQPYASHPYVEEGPVVNVSRGPLHGLRGTLLRKGDHDCLIIAIGAIRRAASVTVDRNTLTSSS